MAESAAERLKIVRDEIEKTAVNCGRNPKEIRLVAVSKVFGIKDILEVYKLGHLSFGESRAQELRDKAKDLKEYGIDWHFIGPLQKNKIKYVVPNSSLIHAVDSLELAKAISEYCKKNDMSARILLEIKTSSEESKHGFESNKIKEFIHEISELPSLDLNGLMTMAPLTDNQAEIRKSFSQLRHVRDDLQLLLEDKTDLTVLSMGMSGDFKIAIEEGSTLVRIGTAIFGPRRSKE